MNQAYLNSKRNGEKIKDRKKKTFALDMELEPMTLRLKV